MPSVWITFILVFAVVLLQSLKGQRYRLEGVVGELQAAVSTAAVDYQTALLAFINCLIISTPQLQDRIRMRNEFIGEFIYLFLLISRAIRLGAPVMATT